jgi:hypothetical protein
VESKSLLLGVNEAYGSWKIIFNLKFTSFLSFDLIQSPAGGNVVFPGRQGGILRETKFLPTHATPHETALRFMILDRLNASWEGFDLRRITSHQIE